MYYNTVYSPEKDLADRKIHFEEKYKLTKEEKEAAILKQASIAQKS